MNKELYIHIDKDGDKFYFTDSAMKILHRADGPAIEMVNGTKVWCANGVLHRTDGPAVEWADGYRSWWMNGKRHRTDGPAIEWSDGTKEWYANGDLHRTDGPAVERANGTKTWYLNGVRYMEKEFERIVRPQPVELTLDEIAAKFGVDVKDLKIVK